MNKKIVFIVLFIGVLFLFSLGEKRRAPLPLKELQNPKGPSYVPVPYPQTREEIITDVKHIIKELYKPRKNRFSVHAGNSKKKQKILLELLKQNGKLKVGKILKIKNFDKFFPEDYAILVDILDESDLLQARMCFEASGIWTQTSFYNEETKKKVKRLDGRKEVKEIFFQRLGKKIGSITITDMDCVIFSYSYLTSPIYPTWIINTTSGTFYMDSIRYDVFEFKEIFSLKKFRAIKDKEQREKVRKAYIKRCPVSIQDDVNDILIGLEKVTDSSYIPRQ